MTIATTTNVVSFTGNAVTTNFAFTFKVFASGDIKVYQNVSGVETLLTVATHYTISLNPDQNASAGGSITMLTAPAVATTILIQRVVASTQEVDLVNGGAFYADTIEIEFDKLTMLSQQNAEVLLRTVTVPVTSTVTPTNYLATLEALDASATASASTATTQASNALTSANNAAASYDSFDDRYLGAKASDPTLDNDGNTLLVGALYFNSINSVMLNWTGSAWVSVVAATTAGGVVNTPSGNIAATTVQTALNELDTEKAKLTANTFTGLQTLAAGADIASATTVDLTAATGNTVTITGTTAVTAFTMTAGQQMTLIAAAALPLTYNATTMNITGGVSYTCAAGDRLTAFKDLAGVIRVNVTKQDGTAAAPLSYIRLNTANGYGSTNTKIRRLTNIVNSGGSDITYADSATLGASFTINVAGVYSASYNDNWNAVSGHGLSINSTQLSTALSSITVTDVLTLTTTGAADNSAVASATFYAAAGAVVRPHTSGSTGGAGAAAQFSIARVA